MGEGAQLITVVGIAFIDRRTLQLIYRVIMFVLQAILLGQGDLRSDLLPAEVFAGDKASKYYLPYRQSYVGAAARGRGQAWMYLVIDFSTGQVTFHRPKLVKDPPPAADLPEGAVAAAAAAALKELSDEAKQDQQVFTRLLATLDAKRVSVGDLNCPDYVLQRAADNVTSWKFNAISSRPKATIWAAADAPAASSLTWCRCSNLYDFGIAVLIGMEFEYPRLSLAWDAADISSVVRPNFSFWLLKGELPMH
jgi:hypothetical protein